MRIVIARTACNSAQDAAMGSGQQERRQEYVATAPGNYDPVEAADIAKFLQIWLAKGLTAVVVE